MAMHWAKGDFRSYANIFWTSISYSLVTLPIVALTVFVLKGALIKISPTSSPLLLAVLVTAFIFQSQITATINGGIRGRGQVNAAMIVDTSFRLLEFGMVISSLTLFRTLTACIEAALIARFLLMSCSLTWLLIGGRPSPLGLGRPSWPTLCVLFPKATSYALGGVAQLGYIQAPVMILGAMLGGASSSAYASMRTMTRLGPQAILPLLDPLRPLMSAAYATENWTELRQAFARSFQLVFWFSISSSVVLVIFGPTIFSLWTLHKIKVDGPLFYILLASSFFYGVSQIILLYLASIAKHSAQSLTALGITAAALGSYFLLPPGLRTMAGVLLGADIVIALVGIASAFKATPQIFHNFYPSMLTPPIWLVVDVWNGLRAAARLPRKYP